MKNKNILMLDTSTKNQIVILCINNKIKTIKQRLGQKDYVPHIIPLINFILEENNTHLKDLDALIVGIGPGSYTGTRVAVLTAKTLAWSLQIPLYKISSLLFLSSGYSYHQLTPLIDARNKYFFGLSLKNNKICLKEGRYNFNLLKTFSHRLLLNEKTIKISLTNIYQFMKKVSNPHLLVPNYLVKTQAENQLIVDSLLYQRTN